jgi:Flp pilus assembly pilin Flp
MRGFTALLKDDDGQDLLEYALLAALVAIAAVAAVNVLQETLRETYVRWDTDMQALADMPNPGA